MFVRKTYNSVNWSNFSNSGKGMKQSSARRRKSGGRCKYVLHCGQLRDTEKPEKRWQVVERRW